MRAERSKAMSNARVGVGNSLNFERVNNRRNIKKSKAA